MLYASMLDDAKQDRNFVLKIVGILVSAGLIPLCIFAVASKWEVGGAGGLAAVGAGLILAAACFVSGSLVGLLFGIPRSIPVTEAAAESRVLAANTNLIEIADWLSKALVGASLTQLTRLPSALAEFGRTFGPELGSSSVAILGLLHFSVSGFLSGYLLTRIVLQGALSRADQDPHSKSGYLIPTEPAVEENPPPKQELPMQESEAESTEEGSQ